MTRKFFLSKEEQDNLLNVIKNGYDSNNTKIRYAGKVAKKILVDESQAIIASIAEHYQERGVEFAKLIKAGNEGLEKAIKVWIENPDKRKFQFMSYATFFIRAYIHKILGLPAYPEGYRKKK